MVGSPKAVFRDYVGGLATDAWQRFEFRPGARNLAGMAIEQQTAGFDDVLRFVVEETDVANVRLQAIDTEIQNLLRRVGNRVQLAGCFVHADVGCLCRQDDRDQQFERRRVFKFGGWGR